VPGPFVGIDAASLPVVIGCDEVGVGAWCGPVVAAAAWFDPRTLPRDLLDALDDSKRLRAPGRAALAAALRGTVRWAVAARSARAIDAHGLRPMTDAALVDALARLGLAGPAVIDGTVVPVAVRGRARALVRAESQVPQVAAASIIAKVCRDGLMARLDARHPAYGWARNAGYGTALHRAGLAARGISAHHRCSYAPLRALQAADSA
jgi:ribonuclease HII